MPLMVILLLALFTIPLCGAWSFLVAMGVGKVTAGWVVSMAGLVIVFWLARGEDA